MPNSILKNICVFVILINSFLSAQNSLNVQYSRADSLYKSECYFDCITELKRLVFFDSSKIFSYDANLMMGKCYKNGSFFNDAVIYFSRAEMNAKNIDDIFAAKIFIVRTNILRDQSSLALRQLEKMEKDSAFYKNITEINYWKGWAFMRLGDWQNANKRFIFYNKDSSLIKLTALAMEKEYSPLKAKLLSVFIPGAGQIYTGNYLSGLLSLAWNLSTGYYTIKAFASSRVFDGLVIGNLLWLRFFSGNINNAEEYAIDKNNILYNDVFYFLETEYSGAKP